MQQDGRIENLEDEVKLLKNEIKHVLSDIEEYILNARTPFNAAVAVDVPNLGVVINQPSQQSSAGPPQGQQATASEPPKPEAYGNGASEASETISSAAGATAEPATPEDHPAPIVPSDGFGDRETSEVGVSSSDLSRAELHPSQGDQAAPADAAQAMDLATVLALSQWVRSATGKIGDTRLEALLEISYSASYLSDQARDVLHGLVRLSDGERKGPDGRVPMRTCMAMLAQLCSILEDQGRPNPGILSLVFDLTEE